MSCYFSFFFKCPFYIDISNFNVNSVDPDQTSRSLVPDLGLHRLLMFYDYYYYYPFLWHARHKWVKY